MYSALHVSPLPIDKKAFSTCLVKKKKVQKWIQRTKINMVLFVFVVLFSGRTGIKIEIIILDQQVVNKFRFLVRKMLARMQVQRNGRPLNENK